MEKYDSEKRVLYITREIFMYQDELRDCYCFDPNYGKFIQNRITELESERDLYLYVYLYEILKREGIM